MSDVQRRMRRFIIVGFVVVWVIGLLTGGIREYAVSYAVDAALGMLVVGGVMAAVSIRRALAREAKRSAPIEPPRA